jgi:hypothetical protein
MWTGVLGFLITLFIGYVVSRLFFAISPNTFGNYWEVDKPKAGNEIRADDHITKDNIDTITSQHLPNPDLFTPMLSKWVRIQNESKFNNELQVSDVMNSIFFFAVDSFGFACLIHYYLEEGARLAIKLYI